MFTRRISVVLCSVVFVLVAVLAVEYGYECAPAYVIRGGQSFTSPSPDHPGSTIY